MIKYIYNTAGNYVAYLYNNMYCFSNENEHIGFMYGIHLYDYNGKYLGTLTSDDRIIKNKYEVKSNISPKLKPLKPLKPLTPLKRFPMTSLNSNYIDIFEHKNTNVNYDEFDKKFSKLLDTKIYSTDGKFLGNLNLNRYDRNSIANPYGNYGSQYSSNSIFNKYGNYGSQYSNKSPFNEYSKSPLLVKNNNNEVIARISSNKYISSDVIDITDFLNWFKDKIE